MTAPLPPLVDAGNALLDVCHAQLATGTIEVCGKPTGVLTVRTPSTTLTVILSKSDLRRWQSEIGSLADSLSETGIIAIRAINRAERGPQDLGSS